MTIDNNTLIARRVFDALDRQDIGAFMLLCDPEVELCRFTSAPNQDGSRDPSYAMVPIQGRQAIAAWLGEVFAAYPGMRFALQTFDPVGESIFCDATVSFSEDPLRNWFVLTMHEGRLAGFEVFHPDTEGIEHAPGYSIAWGQLRLRGRSSAITPPRPCAWVFYNDVRGLPTSVRLYATKAQALEAAREQEYGDREAERSPISGAWPPR
ncbi:MAG: nuclear transport factor 2 family protein [Actinomycetota bacterium]|nr:nuclear transport factor 2 family protein [Actinomycetota bacterium]